jgi:hypothetical protein
MISKPVFLQGIFEVVGAGVDKPALLHPSLSYTVPPGITTQPLYFRGGNASYPRTTPTIESSSRWSPMMWSGTVSR